MQPKSARTMGGHRLGGVCETAGLRRLGAYPGRGRALARCPATSRGARLVGVGKRYARVSNARSWTGDGFIKNEMSSRPDPRARCRSGEISVYVDGAISLRSHFMKWRVPTPRNRRPPRVARRAQSPPCVGSCESGWAGTCASPPQRRNGTAGSR